MMKMSLGSEWKKVSRRYKNVNALTIIERGIALWGADLMVALAKEEIDKLVYLAPPPPSAEGHEEEYLAHNRTNRTRKAITRQRMTDRLAKNISAFRAFVDKSFYDAYYYARILNYGGRPGGRMANYKKRPFWTNAATKVAAQFKQRGLTVRTEIKNHITKG